jgi:ADP-ribose pyrophosphatase YjhB (NUDIX family)
MSEPIRKVSIVFLLTNQNILLAMKKRGFGQGHWNGVGGKPNPGESIEDTAIRECQEEIEVTPLKLKEVAILNFFSPPEKSQNNQQAHVYICKQWEGKPTETEEMKPKWFPIDKVPYEEMWPDDIYWLPQLLKGQKLIADIFFDINDNYVKHDIKKLAPIN